MTTMNTPLDGKMQTIEDDICSYYVIPTNKAKLILGVVGLTALGLGCYIGASTTNARWVLECAKVIGGTN